MPYFVYILSIIIFLFNALPAHAGQTSSVNATVKIGSCGYPYIVEGDEDCESTDLQGETCRTLGYTGGHLICDISCSFDTSSCVAPNVSASNITPDKANSLIAAGYAEIPVTASLKSTPNLTTTTELTVKVTNSNGTSSIVLPDGVVVTKEGGSNFDPTKIIAADVSVNSLSGLPTNETAKGSVEWGIAGSVLEFDEPITIILNVGESLNGQSLNIYRSTNPDSGWTTTGIVSPATCTVSGGLCTFRTTKASYFIATSSSSSSSSSSSNSDDSVAVSSSITSTTPTSSPPIFKLVGLPIRKIPDVLKFYTEYLDGDKIRKSDLYIVVQTWVVDWRKLLADTRTSENTQTDQVRCDLDGNKDCNIQDLSILLYYIEDEQ